MPIHTRATTLLCLLAACASPSGKGGSQASAPEGSGPWVSDRPWSAPDLARATSVRDGRAGQRGRTLSFDAMLDALADYDVVFLGETHTDETTHRVELAVYEGLLQRRGGKVVLAMEMFERDVQGALDDYVGGAVDEGQFLKRARPWGNYHTAYRPLVERARRAGKPVLGSNFPRPLRGKIAAEGGGLLEDLRAEVPELVPAELLPNTDHYWRRVDNAVRGHLAMMGGSDQTPEERLTSTQSLWDNSMGETCALALERFPDHQVVHVNGGFHSAYRDGTARQFGLRRPDASFATVHIVPVGNPSVAGLGDTPAGDFVVFAEQRASDVYDGHWSVQVPREVDYLFEQPAAASADRPVPLLVWFGDRGLAASDGLALWRERLGDECAIAVLEPPYRESQEDLGVGGRWAWPDSFSADISAMHAATERSVSFLLRHYDLDPERICLAGEGTGATVAAAVALLSERYDFRGVAFEPRHYSKVRDFPLPLDKQDREGGGSLRLRTSGEARDWWQEEFRQWAQVSFDAALLEAPADPWKSESDAENALREALGLPSRGAEAAPAVRRHIVARGPRARFWSRLAAVRHQRETGEAVAVLTEDPAGVDSTPLDLACDPGSFGADNPPPRCPGSFGGTTVLVLSDAASDEEREAWLALEEADPLQARSRFHRMRVASLGGEGDERDLERVLATLIEEHRTNVMIVPAEFCADGDRMRALRRRVEPFEDALTLHWRPGLGGLD